MDEGEVRFTREGNVGKVTFDRPSARNAMTWRMYEQLHTICGEIQADPSLRVAVFRGAGGKAFVAGTDISQFVSFKTGEDGIAYEQRMEGYLEAIESIPIPTLAVIEGWAIGGGLAIASVCDLRIATPGARFGVPIARTLGNCLSMTNYARIVASLGPATAKRMLLMADMITAEEAQNVGFVIGVVEPTDIERRIVEICERLAGNAPLTIRVSKEAIRRLLHAGLPDGDDLVRACYGSEDFRHGVRAFVDKREPQWRGR
ncbi:MAG: enoyl-CoA hydratase/isomerase family protein [Bradyrhizobiaceae bacterium]|nr:enoyl-CoA hydratase/isomerase family protein [Bradyrhizobiaceae bacterium]